MYQFLHLAPQETYFNGLALDNQYSISKLFYSILFYKKIT